MTKINLILLPLVDDFLALPEKMLLELVDCEAVVPIAFDNSLVLGSIKWQKMKLPVCSLEKLVYDKATIGINAKVAMLAVKTAKTDEIMAVMVQDKPLLYELQAGAIIEEEKMQPPFAFKIKTSDKNLLIPDFDFISSALNQKSN